MKNSKRDTLRTIFGFIINVEDLSDDENSSGRLSNWCLSDWLSFWKFLPMGRTRSPISINFKASVSYRNNGKILRGLSHFGDEIFL